MLTWKLAVSASGAFQLLRKEGLIKLEAVQAHICSSSASTNIPSRGVVPVLPCIACRNEPGSLQEGLQR